MTKQDKRAEEVKRLRAKSHSWRSVAKNMGISVSTAIRLEKLVTREPAASEAPLPEPEPKPVAAPVEPAQIEVARREAQKVILAHRIRGEWVPRELSEFEHARHTGKPAILAVKAKMRVDGATMDDVEKYVEAHFRA